MNLYLDESGDLGFTFDKPNRYGGSSRHLTIAILLTPKELSHGFGDVQIEPGQTLNDASFVLFAGDPLLQIVRDRQDHGVSLPVEHAAGGLVDHPAVSDEVAGLGQRHPGEENIERPHQSLVIRFEKTNAAPALDGHVVAGRHVKDAVELEHLGHHYQRAEDFVEETETRVILTRQRPPVGPEMRTGVLQQQPLDDEHFARFDDPRASIDTKLHQHLALIGLGEDAKRVADAAGQIDFDRRVAKTAQAQLIEESEPLEQELEAVL